MITALYNNCLSHSKSLSSLEDQFHKSTRLSYQEKIAIVADLLGASNLPDFIPSDDWVNEKQKHRVIYFEEFRSYYLDRHFIPYEVKILWSGEKVDIMRSVPVSFLESTESEIRNHLLQSDNIVSTNISKIQQSIEFLSKMSGDDLAILPFAANWQRLLTIKKTQ